ncbi:MAG: methionyl-tRNA formyltransferase [Clostridia bacterium]|nr:methionyl-tRNA formyltransferase [Clostridia bacterium]
MNIVFMGTPDYAVPTLEALNKAGHNILGVFAQPDKAVGRKQILTPPPVKVYAEGAGIKVYQPATLKSDETFEMLKSLRPDLIVVVAYGKILPKRILRLPKFGCVNGHASLLPKYRGASPIQWAIINGEKKTGVTTMYMDEGLDTGDIIDTAQTNIGEYETAEELFERLSKISAELMVSTVQKIALGSAKRIPQPQEEVSYAPIIKKEMARLDFNKTSKQLFDEVRGYYSWPCSFFFLKGKRIKVVKAKVGAATDKAPGTVVNNKEVLAIACKDGGTLEIIEVIPEGAKRMSAVNMLRGNKVELGERVNNG